MPTQRGLQVMQLSDEILADVEAHYAEQLGQHRYAPVQAGLADESGTKYGRTTQPVRCWHCDSNGEIFVPKENENVLSKVITVIGCVLQTNLFLFG